jgi:cytochrome c biogenesis protein CcdA
MFDIPIAYAFSAGMIATINPCGFAMLPAYIAYNLGLGEESGNAARRAMQGVFLGLVATSGFVFLFGIVGLIIAAGGRLLIHFFPYAGLGIGIGLVLLGLYLTLSKKHLGLLFASRFQGPKTLNSSRRIFAFGVAYGAASLSCTLPIFLVVVGSALAAGGFVSGFVQFISFGLGMGLVLVLVTVGVVFFKTAITAGARAVMPYVEKIGNLALVAAGSYLIYYWTFGVGGVLLSS